LFSIGELYQSRGKASEAIASFRRLVQEYPDSREAAEGQYH
jgi:TolA-binding protein